MLGKHLENVVYLAGMLSIQLKDSQQLGTDHWGLSSEFYF